MQPLPELYPGMGKTPRKSILKKCSSIERNEKNGPEFFISDLSLKEDELNGRLKVRPEGAARISFKEEIKVSYIKSYKLYNGTGEQPSEGDSNCKCVLF